MPAFAPVLRPTAPAPPLLDGTGPVVSEAAASAAEVVNDEEEVCELECELDAVSEVEVGDVFGLGVDAVIGVVLELDEDTIDELRLEDTMELLVAIVLDELTLDDVSAEQVLGMSRVTPTGSQIPIA